jgi:hypothetical protein
MVGMTIDLSVVRSPWRVANAPVAAEAMAGGQSQRSCVLRDKRKNNRIKMPVFTPFYALLRFFERVSLEVGMRRQGNERQGNGKNAGRGIRSAEKRNKVWVLAAICAFLRVFADNFNFLFL